MTTDALIDKLVAALGAQSVAVLPLDNGTLLERLELEAAVRLPDSYRSLISRFDFGSFDLGGISLYGTTASEDYESVLVAPFRDRHLYDVVRAAGFVPFARPITGSYDPVCFDTRKAASHHEYPIVQLDHEQALCYARAKALHTLAGSFRELAARFVNGG